MSPRWQALFSALIVLTFALVAVNEFTVESYALAFIASMIACIHTVALIGSVLQIADERKAQIKRNGGIK